MKEGDCKKERNIWKKGTQDGKETDTTNTGTKKRKRNGQEGSNKEIGQEERGEEKPGSKKKERRRKKESKDGWMIGMMFRWMLVVNK